jgi:hypothetical protein
VAEHQAAVLPPPLRTLPPVLDSAPRSRAGTARTRAMRAVVTEPRSRWCRCGRDEPSPGARWAGVPFRHDMQPPANAQQAYRSARVERFISQALCGSFDPQTPRCISRTISFAVFAEEDTGWATSTSGAACDGEAEAAPRRDGHASLFALWRSHLLPRLRPRVQLECPEDCRSGVTWLRSTQSGHRPLPPVGTVLATFEWPSCPP